MGAMGVPVALLYVLEKVAQAAFRKKLNNLRQQEGTARCVRLHILNQGAHIGRIQKKTQLHLKDGVDKARVAHVVKASLERRIIIPTLFKIHQGREYDVCWEFCSYANSSCRYKRTHRYACHNKSGRRSHFSCAHAWVTMEMRAR